MQRYKRGKLGLPTSKSYSTRHDRPIHGKGLFARKHIGAGELIGILDGVPTSTDGEHVLWLGEENGIHVKCDLRSINHSDEPNAE